MVDMSLEDGEPTAKGSSSRLAIAVTALLEFQWWVAALLAQAAIVVVLAALYAASRFYKTLEQTGEQLVNRFEQLILETTSLQATTMELNRLREPIQMVERKLALTARWSVLSTGFVTLIAATVYAIPIVWQNFAAPTWAQIASTLGPIVSAGIAVKTMIAEES